MKSEKIVGWKNCGGDELGKKINKLGLSCAKLRDVYLWLKLSVNQMNFIKMNFIKIIFIKINFIKINFIKIYLINLISSKLISSKIIPSKSMKLELISYTESEIVTGTTSTPEEPS